MIYNESDIWKIPKNLLIKCDISKKMRLFCFIIISYYSQITCQLVCFVSVVVRHMIDMGLIDGGIVSIYRVVVLCRHFWEKSHDDRNDRQDNKFSCHIWQYHLGYHFEKRIEIGIVVNNIKDFIRLTPRNLSLEVAFHAPGISLPVCLHFWNDCSHTHKYPLWLPARS